MPIRVGIAAMMSEAGGLAPSAGEPAFYTVGEVARMVGVTRQAIQARAQRGSLRAEKVDGVWRIPAEAARGLVRAEQDKAVSSGAVRFLSAPSAAETPAVDGALFLEVRRLAQRLEGLEERLVTQDRVLEQLVEDQRRELDVKERELRELVDDRRRLRRALATLVDETDS